jgi:hypothetical protein
MVIVPLFVVLFVATAALSYGLGAPDAGGAPVFAARAKYRFTRGEEVSRARFVAVGMCFHLAWHLMAIGFAAEQWASLRRTDSDPTNASPFGREEKGNSLDQH